MNDAQTTFVSMLPEIERLCWSVFKGRRGARENVAEAIGLAWKGFLACHAAGKQVTAGNLAWYATRQVRDGRRLATPPGRSVTGTHARRRGIVQDQSRPLDEYFGRQATPVEVVALRIDVPQFLEWLSPVMRRTAEALIGAGPDTLGKDIALRLGITPGRLSQRRRELIELWHEFTA